MARPSGLCQRLGTLGQQGGRAAFGILAGAHRSLGRGKIGPQPRAGGFARFDLGHERCGLGFVDRALFGNIGKTLRCIGHPPGRFG